MGAGAGSAAGTIARAIVLLLLFFRLPLSIDPITLLLTFVSSSASPIMYRLTNSYSTIKRLCGKHWNPKTVTRKEATLALWGETRSEEVECEWIDYRLRQLLFLTRSNKIWFCWCWPIDKSRGDDREQNPGDEDQNVSSGGHLSGALRREMVVLGQLS